MGYDRMRKQISSHVDCPFGGRARSGFDLHDELKLSDRIVYRNIGSFHRLFSTP